MRPADPVVHTTTADPSGTTQHPGSASVGSELKPGAQGVEGESGTHLELVEEQLEAKTRPVQVGEVLIRKEVVTETRTIEVQVRREEIVIERRAVERRPADQPEELAADELERSLAARFRALQEGETIRLALTEEEIVVQKRPVVYEEVLIGKRALQDTERVSGSVRREELRVARRGEVAVSHVRWVGGQGADKPNNAPPPGAPNA